MYEQTLCSDKKFFKSQGLIITRKISKSREFPWNVPPSKLKPRQTQLTGVSKFKTAFRAWGGFGGRGARDRNRTSTPLRAADFESAASTNFATRAKWAAILRLWIQICPVSVKYFFTYSNPSLVRKCSWQYLVFFLKGSFQKLRKVIAGDRFLHDFYYNLLYPGYKVTPFVYK